MYFGTRLFVVAFGAALLPHFAASQQQPRVSRYTALSAMAIQAAQSEEDPMARDMAYQEVLTAILNGIQNENDNPEAYLHLGIVHAALTDYMAADSAFDQAEALYPDYEEEENGTGVYRFNGWIEAYNQAVAIQATDPAAAVEIFRSANILFDKRPEAYLNIGAQLHGLGDLEGSIEGWRRAIAILESPDADPGDDATREAWENTFWPMAHTNLAQVLTMADRSAEAIPLYEKLLERDPENSAVRSSLAMALSNSGQGDDALSIFDEILAREDGSPLDYFNAGVSLYSADQLDKAVVGFEKVLDRAPNYRDALQNLVQSLAVLENYEASIPHAERLLELDPYNEYAYQLLMRALVQVDREPDAVVALELLQALPFTIDNLQLQPSGSGVTIVGVAVNKTMDPGSSIKLRFNFYDGAGSSLGSEDAEVTISDPEVGHSFQVVFDSETTVLGYGYELGS
jgi:tetratricopeptide (TPR) repeat protein